MNLDLNCDLGEGEPLSRTRALMRWITSANVACGGHAGDERSMAGCVRLAKLNGVRVGAHPGPWSRGDFGRDPVSLTPAELKSLLQQQVGVLERIARYHGVRLHHIKLHGALYHATESNDALRRCYVRVIAQCWPLVRVFALAGGKVAARASAAGLRVWEEAFVDRAYRDDGTLVPRSESGAILRGVAQARERALRLVGRGEVLSTSGKPLLLDARTLCLHSDTPRATALAHAVAECLSLRR